ncbi:MAG TPA: pitrilysin family protein, partial [Polyangiaceae bacterium]
TRKTKRRRKPLLPFQTTTLPNGLRVVATAQPQLHRAHVALYVRVGSRFEDPKTNGLSHFLEHMIYRGTPRLPSAHAVNDAFESLGGYLYAATQTDYGIFSVTVPPESLDAASSLFGEVLRAPSFFDIEVEKGIVCEEILEDLDDEGRQIDADNLSRELIYPTHPLGYTITGDEARVRSFTDEMCRTHHAKHYVAQNAVLAFAGAVDPARALDLAARDFGALASGGVTRGDTPVHAQKKPRLRIVDNVSSQTELRVCLRAMGESAPERAAIEMLMRLVDDGMSTRLYHRICDDKGLCYDVSGGYDGYEDDGVIDFAAGVQHARASVVTREILTMLEDLAQTGPTEDELAKAKRRHAWDLTALADSAEDAAGFYAGGLIFDRFETVDERQASLGKITREEIRDLAQRLAQPDRLNVVAVGLLEDGEDKRLTEVVKGWRGAK